MNRFQFSMRRIDLLCLSLFLPFLAGCGRGGSTAGAKESVKPAPQVKVDTPRQMPLTRKIVQPGEVHAYLQTPMFARISGHVLNVYKDIGDVVKDGELMADLFVPEKEQEKKQKEALVLQATAEVEQAQKLFAAAQADVTAAAAKVTEAKANRARALAERERAESQLARFQKSAGVFTPDMIDEARLSVEAAKAGEAEVEAKIGSAQAEQKSKEARRDKAKSDIAVANARLQVAQADDAYAGAILGFARITAPFDGIVIQRKVDPRHFVQPAAVVPLFIVASIDPVRVVVDVPESEADLVADKAKAEVTIPGLGGLERSGTIKRSSWGLEAKTGRTLRVEINLDNPGRKLRPGMYATASILVERPKTWTLPAAAVVSEAGETFCYRVESGKAKRTPLRVGIRSATHVEVLEKKTNAGWEAVSGREEIVVDGAAALSDGQAVTIQRAAE